MENLEEISLLEGWVWTRLGDIINVIRGASPVL